MPYAERTLVPSNCPWEDRNQLRLRLDQEPTNFEVTEQAHQATQRSASSGSGPKTKGWHAVDSGYVHTMYKLVQINKKKMIYLQRQG